MIKISQSEVYEFLKQNKGKWYTAKQLAEELKLSVNCLRTNLMKLRKTGWIEFKDFGYTPKPFKYRFVK